MRSCGLVVAVALTTASCASREWPVPDVPSVRTVDFHADADALWPGSVAVDITIRDGRGTVQWAQDPGGNTLFGPFVELLAVLDGADPTVPTSAAMVDWQQQTDAVSLSTVAWLARSPGDALSFDPLPPDGQPEYGDVDAIVVGAPRDVFDRRVATAQAGCVQTEWVTGSTPERIERFYDGSGVEPVYELSSTGRRVQRTTTREGDVWTQTNTHAGGRTESASMVHTSDGWFRLEGDVRSRDWTEEDGRVTVAAGGATVGWDGERWTSLESPRHVAARTATLSDDGVPQALVVDSPIVLATRTYDAQGRMQAGSTLGRRGVSYSWSSWRCEGDPPAESMRTVEERPEGYSLDINPMTLTVSETRWQPSACIVGVGHEWLDTRPRAVSPGSCGEPVVDWVGTQRFARAAPATWWRLHLYEDRVSALRPQAIVDAPPVIEPTVIVMSDLTAAVQCAFAPVLDGNTVRALHGPSDCPVALTIAAAEKWVGMSWPSVPVGGVQTPLRPESFVQVFAPTDSPPTVSGEYGSRAGALGAYTTEIPAGMGGRVDWPLSAVVDAHGVPVSVTPQHLFDQDSREQVSLVNASATGVETVDMALWWPVIKDWRFEATGSPRRVWVPSVSLQDDWSRPAEEPRMVAAPAVSEGVLVPLPVLRNETTGSVIYVDANGSMVSRLDLLSEQTQVFVDPDAKWKTVAPALASLPGPVVVDAGVGRRPVERVSQSSPTDQRIADVLQQLDEGEALAVSAVSLPVQVPVDIRPARPESSARRSVDDLTPIYKPEPVWPEWSALDDKEATTCTASYVHLGASGRVRVEDATVDCSWPFRDMTLGLIGRWRFDAQGQASPLEPITVQWTPPSR